MSLFRPHRVTVRQEIREMWIDLLLFQLGGWSCAVGVALVATESWWAAPCAVVGFPILWLAMKRLNGILGDE